jgi:hypothetical protein
MGLVKMLGGAMIDVHTPMFGGSPARCLEALLLEVLKRSLFQVVRRLGPTSVTVFV